MSIAIVDSAADRVFATLDTDFSGKLTEGEVDTTALGKLDTDGDGAVSMSEFRDAFQRASAVIGSSSAEKIVAADERQSAAFHEVRSARMSALGTALEDVVSLSVGVATAGVFIGLAIAFSPLFLLGLILSLLIGAAPELLLECKIHRAEAELSAATEARLTVSRDETARLLAALPAASTPAPPPPTAKGASMRMSGKPV